MNGEQEPPIQASTLKRVYTIEVAHRQVRVLIEAVTTHTYEPLQMLYEEWITPEVARELATRLLQAAKQAERLRGEG